MPLDQRLKRTATTIAFRTLGETRFDDLRAAHMARKIRTGRYSSPEIGVLPRMLGEGDTAIDVGANFGLYAYHFARLTGQTGRVYAFEAVPETCRGLRRVLASLGVEDQVRVVQTAVGASTGTIDFAVPRRPDGSADVGRAGVLPATGGGTAAATLPMTTLDDEVPSSLDVAFMKIDVEGADLFVLQGADGIIARCRPGLLIEVAPTLLARHGLTGADIAAFLDERGYATYRYDEASGRLAPVSADGLSGDMLAVHPQRAGALEPLLTSS